MTRATGNSISKSGKPPSHFVKNSRNFPFSKLQLSHTYYSSRNSVVLYIPVFSKRVKYTHTRSHMSSIFKPIFQSFLKSFESNFKYSVQRCAAAGCTHWNIDNAGKNKSYEKTKFRIRRIRFYSAKVTSIQKSPQNPHRTHGDSSQSPYPYHTHTHGNMGIPMGIPIPTAALMHARSV